MQGFADGWSSQTPPIRLLTMSTSSDFTLATDSHSNNRRVAVMDEDYFMDITPVIFQVENYLFRVPQYLLVKGSETFATMFNLPQREGSVEGSSTENPIVLHVSHVDFRNLLKVLYPQTIARQVSLSKSDWLSVLKLSNLWYFWDLRQMALSELAERDFGHLSALEKIKLGRECYIPDCLLSGYLKLVTRQEPITDEEAIVIGLLATVRLYRFRENFRSNKAGAEKRARENIEAEFREELIDIRKQAEGYLPSRGPAGSSSLG